MVAGAGPLCHKYTAQVTNPYFGFLALYLWQKGGHSKKKSVIRCPYAIYARLEEVA